MKSKKLLRWSIWSAVLLVTAVMATDRWVSSTTHKQLYANVDNIPYNKVGLLLGTSKYLKGGQINYYYQYRIEAAFRIFSAGKISFILISGDNSVEQYNEPETMMADLIALGIPKEKIFLDYAGFRTLDSILRCSAIFGQNSFTLISQPFHNERALFIANHKNLTAIGYNAQDVGSYGLKTQIREKFARIKMLLDLLTSKKAKFYGPTILIR